MRLKNLDIFFILTFLLFFGATHFLLAKYHVNYLSKDKKLLGCDSETCEHISNKEKDRHINKNLSHVRDFAKFHHLAFRDMSRLIKYIKEPPVPKGKEHEFALNINYFSKRANYTIFATDDRDANNRATYFRKECSSLLNIRIKNGTDPEVFSDCFFSNEMEARRRHIQNTCKSIINEDRNVLHSTRKGWKFVRVVPSISATRLYVFKYRFVCSYLFYSEGEDL